MPTKTSALESLVVVVCATVVATFFSMTLLLGTAAPLESLTTPLNEAVDSCAKPVPDSNRIPLRRHACHKPNTLQVFHHSTEDFIKRTLALREALYIACPPKSLLDLGLRN